MAADSSPDSKGKAKYSEREHVAAKLVANELASISSGPLPFALRVSEFCRLAQIEESPQRIAKVRAVFNELASHHGSDTHQLVLRSVSGLPDYLAIELSTRADADDRKRTISANDVLPHLPERQRLEAALGVYSDEQFERLSSCGETKRQRPREMRRRISREQLRAFAARGESHLAELLSGLFPHDHFETDNPDTSRPARLPGSSATCIWVLEPIDGVHNYARLARPEWAISAARLTPAGHTDLAAISLPTRGLTISMEQPPGSRAAFFLNAQPMSLVPDAEPLHILPPPESLADAVVMTPGDFSTMTAPSGPHNANPISQYARMLDSLAAQHAGFKRQTGSIAYDLASMVLGDECDVRVSLRVDDADMVAGTAMVRALGGVVWNDKGTDWQRGDTRMVAARSAALAREAFDKILLPVIAAIKA